MQNLALVSAAEASALVASQGNPDQFAKPQNIFRRSTSSNRGSSGSAPHAPSPRAGRAVGAQEDPTKSMLTNAWPTVDGAKSAKAFAEQAEFLSRLVSLNPSLTFSQQTPNASQLNARQKNPFRPSIATATSTLTTPSVSSAPSPRASAAVVSSAPKLPPVKRSATTPKASSGGHFGFSTMTKHNLLSSTQLDKSLAALTSNVSFPDDLNSQMDANAAKLQARRVALHGRLQALTDDVFVDYLKLQTQHHYMTCERNLLLQKNGELEAKLRSYEKRFARSSSSSN